MLSILIFCPWHLWPCFMGPICVLSTATLPLRSAIPLKRDNRTLWKISVQQPLSDEILHLLGWFKTTGALLLGKSWKTENRDWLPFKFPNWKNIVIVLVVVLNIFYFSPYLGEMILTTYLTNGLKPPTFHQHPPTLVIDGIFNKRHLLFPWLQASPNHCRKEPLQLLQWLPQCLRQQRPRSMCIFKLPWKPSNSLVFVKDVLENQRNFLRILRKLCFWGT